MIVDNQVFDIEYIEQEHILGGLCGTKLRAAAESLSLECSTLLHVLTDTGISLLDGREAYVGKVEHYPEHVSVTFILVEPIPLLQR